MIYRQLKLDKSGCLYH